MLFKEIEYELLRSSRRSLAVEVKSGGRVIVRAPEKLSEKYIFQFLNRRYDWLCRAVENQRARGERQAELQKNEGELRALARDYIPSRVEYWSNVTGLYPSAVKITGAKTRFGSCSPKNSLSFSFYLMAYPSEAIDYVIVHELAHIKFKNHQKQFYTLVEKYLPGYKKAVQLLKKT